MWIGRLSRARQPSYPFDPQRYINWRFFWDYDGSNVYENMVHQVGFWYKLMDFKIPDSVTMTGANLLSPKMQVPDTIDVSHAARECPVHLEFHVWERFLRRRP